MRRSISFFMGMCVALLVTVCVPMVVFASFGLNETAGAAGLTGYGNSVPKIVGNVIGTLLSMISVLFFVLVLYGGILWMTARGNSDQTGKALNTIIGATIGIVIVMGAYALTNFVFQLGGNTGNGGGNSPNGGNENNSPVGDNGSQWCLTAENTCVQGGGGPCSGTIQPSETACNAARANTQWCLTAENTCVQGGGGPCSGTIQPSETACNAARANTQWCLTAENTCVQGGGGPCSGTIQPSETACNAARANNG